MAFAGVELPENFESPSEKSEQAPVSDSGTEPISKANPPEAPAEALTPLDLDKLERFRLNGREWSPKDLRSAVLRHEDYTKKTMEVAEARKYAENFDADLQTLLRDPSRFADFRAVYPKAYVELAERWLNYNQQKPNASSVESARPETQSEYDKRIAQLESRFQDWDKSQRQTEITQIESWLNNQYETLSKKYPFAESEMISARAEVLANQGTEISKEVLEKLFKANNDEIKDRWEKHYQQKVKEQQTTGLKAKDMGSGGGVPGQAPRGFKTIKEATRAWESDLEAR